MVAAVGGAAAILEQQALEAAVVGLAHGGVDADVGGDAGEHQIVDAALAHDQLEVGGAERALARLVDHGLARQRRQFGDDFPARLAAHQDAPARARIADPGADLARAPALVGRQVGEVGTMALAGVEDRVPAVPQRRQHRPDRLDRRAGQRQVVAHPIDIAALAAEVGLHVDDDQRRVGGPQVAVPGPAVGVGGYVMLGHRGRSRAIGGHRWIGVGTKSEPALAGARTLIDRLEEAADVVDEPAKLDTQDYRSAPGSGPARDRLKPF